ncbi:short-chain dehydrogenase [Gemmobacter aquaticus]|uniref:Short-chain dehydrogenase n=1 Tax=Gemmobacter aquaticus TaxID=490185 RepID=A0A917YLT1_9RHOB|nr:NnrS family protein [Gemmobacter aquaticus]GGO37149.1 short-chain dehydrogenase [Gemmobacter aquaticus]
MAVRGLWRAPHLSLFLLASLWAALVPLVWLVPGFVCDPVVWHRQELVLGVAGAAVGGYLLTALPHWLMQAGRDRACIGHGPTATQGLVLAWGLGRLLGGPCMPDAPALVGQCLYPIGLAVALALPVITARVWKRLPMALAPLIMVLFAVRMRLDADGLTAVLGIALLVALVGGRIIPAFLHARAGDKTPIRVSLLPLATAASLPLGLALMVHLADLGARWTGLLLLLAALGQIARVIAWPLARGLRERQADLAVLVIAWCWLPLGLALVSMSLSPAVGLGLPTASHALTMGLMGSMVLAVMARAWMRRVPGALQLGALIGMAFALVQLATVLRLLTMYHGLAALSWSAGWSLASIAAVAAVFHSVPRPVLSACRS